MSKFAYLGGKSDVAPRGIERSIVVDDNGVLLDVPMARFSNASAYEFKRALYSKHRSKNA